MNAYCPFFRISHENNAVSFSYLWVKYMAYHLQMAEIDKARRVAERALKAMSPREEEERMNVWIAKLNLENT